MKRDSWESDVGNFITYIIKIYILEVQLQELHRSRKKIKYFSLITDPV